jgi:CitMHS family citrate-Mg2+:H+ or citrate-Ca2+:H+ symporter
MNMLTILSFLMIFTFVALIASKKMSPITALSLVPVAFALILGISPSAIGKFIFTGMQSVFPMIVLIVFAIIYFAVMTDTGMFDPILRTIIMRAKGDPAKIVLGSVILLTLIAISGDATVGVMICVYTLLPIYKKMGMDTYILGLQLGATNCIFNLVPWGPPVIRLQAALGLTPGELFTPIIPSILVAITGVIIGFWLTGLKERKKLGHVELDNETLEEMVSVVTNRNIELKRPKVFWFNVIFFVIVLGALYKEVIPSPLLFFIAAMISLMVNYPSPKDQSKCIAAHASSITTIFAVIASAGVMLGVLNGAQMATAISQSLVAIIPPSFGSHIPVFTSIIGLPGLYFIQGDAYFFGIIPIIAKTAVEYGVNLAELGRASLLGYAFHAVTPTAAPMFLSLALLGLEYGTMLKRYFPWGILVSVCLIGTSLLTGAIHL